MTTRRGFLAMGVAAAGVGAQQPSFLDRKQGRHPYRTTGTAGARRPHIFVISADMMSPDHWLPGRFGSRVMDLPNLRGLFSDSVFFTNAWTTAPLCAPARAALLTGRHSYLLANNERAHDGFETSLRPGDAIFPEYLKATGYVTKHAGKGHLGAQKFFDAFDENADAWDRWDPPIRNDEAYLEFLRRSGVKPQKFARELFGLQQDRKSRGNSLGGWIEQADGKPFPFEAQYSAYLADRAVGKLDAALAAAGDNGPVYLQLDFFDPHQPFSIPAGFEARERELRRALRLPASYERVRARNWAPEGPGEPRIYDTYRRYWGLYEPRTVEDYRVANALQLEVVDRALGRFLKALRDRGLYDEAAIVFTSDHGEMNGRQAVVDKGVYLHPEVLRVPLAVKMPKSSGMKPRVSEEAVSHLDVSPTVLALAGVECGERQDGTPLQPVLAGQSAGSDRRWLFECGWHVSANFACGMRRRVAGKEFLYSWNVASGADELYDVSQEDPVNLSARTEFQAVRKEMIGSLGEFLERDPRWLAWWSSYRLAHYDSLPRAGGDMQLKGSSR